MLDPKLNDKIAQAYARIGEMGYYIALNMKKGKDHLPRQQELWDKALKLWQYLKIITRHVDCTTTPPTLIRITEKQVNRLIKCMDKIGQLDKVPVFPTLLSPCKPVRILETPPPGPPGENGEDGSNAFITVEPEEGETEISVREEVVGLVKKYYLAIERYELPAISVAVTAPKVYIQGTLLANKNVSVTTTVGSKPITTLVVTNPGSLDAAFQAGLNLASLNAAIQPVVTTLSETNVNSDRTYTFTVGDGTNTVSDTDTLRFYFPYLYGSTAGTSFDRFTTLSKIIAGKGTTEFTFNAEDNYFWIAFPSSYIGVGQNYVIKDQNGFVVTEEFTATVEDIDSAGLDEDWTEEYIVLRTTLITDINGIYTVEFI